MALYRFVEWRDAAGNVLGTDPALTLMVDADITVIAYYVEVTVEYTLNIDTTLGGTTNPSPGSYSSPEGSTVNVTAIPDSGYLFDHWILDGVSRGENPINITMDADHTITAYFAEEITKHTLTISTPAGGTTNPAPGIHEYPEGTSVSVEAIPDVDYEFDYWTLDGIQSVDNPITVIMDADHVLTAFFKLYVPPQYILIISAEAGGTTNPAPGEYSYAEGTSVTVAALPNTGYYFVYWLLDGVQYSSTPITVLMDGNHTLVAAFSEEAPPPPDKFKLYLTSTVGGITDPAPNIYEFDANTEVPITAIPEENWFFNYWVLNGNTVTDNPIVLVMYKDHTILAVFSETPLPIKEPFFPRLRERLESRPIFQRIFERVDQIRGVT